MILKAKKKLGQHFLINDNIAEIIVDSITCLEKLNIVEVGPGEGALTKFLIKKSALIKLVEIDKDAVELLKYKFPKTKIIKCNFLNNEKSCIFSGRHFFSWLGLESSKFW